MSAIAAFLHHIALISIMLTLTSAKEIQHYDVRRIRHPNFDQRWFARNVFEKDVDYYMHSAPFIAKIMLFLIIGLISIHPAA